jgi:hypothetical protein
MSKPRTTRSANSGLRPNVSSQVATLETAKAEFEASWKLEAMEGVGEMEEVP